MHFLPWAEVFSGFFIVTPIGISPSKKGVKVSCLPLQPKDFLIFCILLFIPHLLGFVKQSGIFFSVFFSIRLWRINITAPRTNNYPFFINISYSISNRYLCLTSSSAMAKSTSLDSWSAAWNARFTYVLNDASSFSMASKSMSL